MNSYGIICSRILRDSLMDDGVWFDVIWDGVTVLKGGNQYIKKRLKKGLLKSYVTKVTDDGINVTVGLTTIFLPYGSFDAIEDNGSNLLL